MTELVYKQQSFAEFSKHFQVTKDNSTWLVKGESTFMDLVNRKEIDDASLIGVSHSNHKFDLSCEGTTSFTTFYHHP
jgi:hypothetical protein